MDRSENIAPPGRFFFGLPLALEVPIVFLGPAVL